MNKHDPSYLPACGAGPITIIERDAIRTSPEPLAGSLAVAPDVPSAIAAVTRSAASLLATLTPDDVARDHFRIFAKT